MNALTQPEGRGGRKNEQRLNAHRCNLTQPDGRERVIRINKQRMPIVTSLTQPDGGERVIRMNKQRMPIVTSLTQPDGRERVIRINKQ